MKRGLNSEVVFDLGGLSSGTFAVITNKGSRHAAKAFQGLDIHVVPSLKRILQPNFFKFSG